MISEHIILIRLLNQSLLFTSWCTVQLL